MSTAYQQLRLNIDLFTKNRFQILLGDSVQVLKELPDDSVDLIITSPPYSDQRKNSYGGIRAEDYVAWFLPITAQLKRVLKPRGTFILNIKEKVINGERSTYVLELIIAMREQGWLWTEEFIWNKKIHTLVNGQTVFETVGKDCYNSIVTGNLPCTRMR